MAARVRGLALWAVVALLVGLVIGIFVSPYILAPARIKPKTFWVVAYHWGFAYFKPDAEGKLVEVPRIEVNRGDLVVIYVMGGEALPHELHEAFEERTMKNGIGPLKPGDPAIHEKMEEAEEQGLLAHGFAILEYGIDVRLAGMPERAEEAAIVVSFVADKAGTFAVVCTVFCGFGHPYMIDEDGLVVTG